MVMVEDMDEFLLLVLEFLWLLVSDFVHRNSGSLKLGSDGATTTVFLYSKGMCSDNLC